METINNFWFPSLLLIVFLQIGLCTRVQFYQKPFYHGFIKEVELNGPAESECISVSNTFIEVGSLKTDRCLILYNSHGCKRLDNFTRSFRVEKNERDLNFTFIKQNLTRAVASFHVCSQSRGGGAQVDVDFYEKSFYEGRIAAGFRDVCGCQNLPRVAWGGKYKQISVDNHGRSIDLFESENCKAEYRTLEAGYTEESLNLWISRKLVDLTEREDRVFDVRSFRPSGNQSCIRMDARIYKFQFRNGSIETGGVPLVTENVKLGANAVLRNEKSTSVLAQEYNAGLKLTETLNFTTPIAFSNMFTVVVDPDYKAEVEGVVPMVNDPKSMGQFALNFVYERSEGYMDTLNRSSVSNDQNISIQQAIQVPPCTSCVVSGFVKMVKNFPIEYTAYARVQGMAVDERMTAEEIRTYLEPGTVYLGSFGENTAETKVTGIIFAEYASKAFISSDCEPIPGCQRSGQTEDIVKKVNTVELQLPMNI